METVTNVRQHLCAHKLENRSDHDQLALKAHLLLLFAYPKTVRLSCKIVMSIQFCLFDLILYVPTNNFSVMLGRAFLG